MQKKFEGTVEALFSLDVRGLALARISFGLLILADLFNRARSLVAHYTDAGVLPHTLLESADLLAPLDVSLHLLNGSAAWQVCLFIIAAVCAVMLVVGYRTRFASVISWVLLVSLQNANPLVLQGGDIAFRVALFWGMFVPWGSVLSVDAKRGAATSPRRGDTCISVGTVAWILSVAMIYIGAAALKNPAYWFGAGATAVESALHIDQFATQIGLFSRTFFPSLFLTIVTNVVFLVQTLAPVTFFVPFKKALVRGIGAGVLILMHASFVPFLRLGLFPFIDIVFLLPLLPSCFFDYICKKLPKKCASYLGMLPEVLHKPNVFGLEALAAIFLFLSVVVNVRAHGPLSIRLPDTLENVIELARLDQYWELFAPYPLTEDGWYVVPGTLADGSHVDVFDGGTTVSFEKPARVSADYKTQRWRKYMMNLWMRKYASARSGYAMWQCGAWNSTHDPEEQLKELRLIFMLERTDLANEHPPAEKVVLGSWKCEDL